MKPLRKCRCQASTLCFRHRYLELLWRLQLLEAASTEVRENWVEGLLANIPKGIKPEKRSEGDYAYVIEAGTTTDLEVPPLSLPDYIFQNFREESRVVRRSSSVLIREVRNM